MIEPNKLHAYVDGELNDAERREVEARLAECKASQAEVGAIRGLKTVLSQNSNIECADVWASCKERLDAVDRVARSGNFITKYSWAFVSAVALVVLIGGGYARRAQAGSVDSSALAGIFSSSRRSSPEKDFRNAQLDQLLRFADQNLSKVKFISEARLTVDGQPATRYDIEDSHGRMCLIVLPQVTSFEGMTPNAKNPKYFFGQLEANTNVVAWRIQNAALILVGPREHAQLQNIALTFIQPE